MDSLIPVVIVTVINIIGWVYTRVYSLGRLNEKVERHERLLNDGLVSELSQLKAQVAALDATVKTYIELTKAQRDG
ncbi:MAG: hypothetical protein ACUVTR_01900 [Dehalococcoidia bacterium]